MAPGFLEQFVQNELAEAAGVLGRDFLVADEALDDLRRGGDPATAGSWREDFGEGVEAHDAAVGVHTEEGGGEGGEELGVGGGWGDGGVVGGGGGVGFHLEEVVGFVFEDVDVVFLGDAVDFFTALFGLGCAGGVLARGDGVEEVGFGGAVV